MRLRKVTGLAAALLPLAIQGCGGEQEPADQTTASPTVTPSPVDVLRIDDEGASVSLRVGGTATVFLPASYLWEEPRVDGDNVTISEDVSDEGSSSVSWTVTGRHAGSSTLTLTGSPPCRSETPSCAQPDKSWTAHFTVR